VFSQSFPFKRTSDTNKHGALSLCASLSILVAIDRERKHSVSRYHRNACRQTSHPKGDSPSFRYMIKRSKNIPSSELRLHGTRGREERMSYSSRPFSPTEDKILTLYALATVFFLSILFPISHLFPSLVSFLYTVHSLPSFSQTNFGFPWRRL
jgi:hypothetical protein